MKKKVLVLLLLPSVLFFASRTVAARSIAVNSHLKGSLRYESKESGALKKSQSVETERSEKSQREIQGKVVDESGNPLPGVTIRVKDTGLGTTTDAEGKFLLNIPEDGDRIIVVSFLGFVSQEIPAKGKSTFDIVLVVDKQGQQLNEIVVTGYQQIKKKYLTGSIATVSADELAVTPTTNLSSALAGRLSGVYVSQSSGLPGRASSVRVRSQTSWNTSDPIYVIDGVVRDKSAFDLLSENEVSEISVLKGAAAASIYGSRSSNGVILVTTKSGKAGKPVIQFNSSYSYEEPTFHDKVLSDHESYVLNNVYWQKQTGTNWFGEDEIKMFEEKGYSTNYLDYLYRTPTTKTTSLSVSGGSEKIKFYLGGAYVKNTGFLDNLDFSKYNIRANVTASLTKNLEIGLNISTANNNRHQFNSSGAVDNIQAWYGRLEYLFFYIPIKIDNNLVSTRWQVNFPSTVSGAGGYVSQKNQNVNALFHIKYDVPFIKGMSLTAKYSQDNTNYFMKVFQRKATVYDYGRTGSTGKVVTDELIGKVKTQIPGRESLSNTYQKGNSYQLNGQLSYARDFGEHHIDAMAIYEQSNMSHHDFYLIRYDFPLIVKDQFWATSANNINSIGSGSENYVGRESYVGSVNYRFKDRYLLSSSIRADGSMLFAPGKRWGYFPSVAAAWIVSEESFFKEALPTIRYFKLRASLGYTGNDAVGGWQWKEAYYGAGQYFLGGSNQNVIRYGGIVNKDLTWEKSRSTNFGIEMLTTSNIGLNISYWKRHTYDILGQRIILLPTTFGGTLPDENYGIVDAHGFELEATYGNNLGDFKYNIRANFSFATNKVKKADFAANGLAVDNPNGKTLGYIATYKSTGIIRTQKELDALPDGYTILGRVPVLGSLNYEDISGVDGVPDGKIDTYDRQVISKYGPGNIPYSAGLNFDLSWKGFSASIFFQSLLGYKKLYTDNWNRGFPLDARLYAFWGDAWSSDNTDGKYPAIAGPVEPNSSMASSFWYEDASFIRLKSVLIGYDLPHKWLDRVNIKKIRLYVSGTNLFYLSGFHWYDPESPSLASYPNMKQFSFGLNVTL